jgi:hypothetical protein
MGTRLSQTQKKPGGTGVPSVPAQVANLCHLVVGTRCEHKNFLKKLA